MEENYVWKEEYDNELSFEDFNKPDEFICNGGDDDYDIKLEEQIDCLEPLNEEDVYETISNEEEPQEPPCEGTELKEIVENKNEPLFFMWLVRYSNKELEREDWEEYLEVFQEWCKDHCKKWTFQLEYTEDNFHIQGAITLLEKKRLSYLVKRFNSEECWFNGIHLEPAKDYEALTAYSSKDDDTKVSRVYSNKNNGYFPKGFENAKLRFWQQTLTNMLYEDPSNRKVLMIGPNPKTGADGSNCGKSWYINYLLCNPDFQDRVCIIPEGTSIQINSCIRQSLKNKRMSDDIPLIFIFDQMKACKRIEQVENQYKQIESIKSRRLEPCSAMNNLGDPNPVIIPNSHVIVFCNKLYPKLLSKDRYSVFSVEKDTESVENFYLKPIEFS
jgi:hypothetical protein